MATLVEELTDLLTQLNGYRHTEPTDELVQFIEKREIQAKIDQSYRCQELIAANAQSEDDENRYGEIVLLDVDDLEEELKVLNG